MNLESFGQTLRTLRRRIGVTQNELARQLSITAQLLSIWERAYRHRGRTWVPDRQSAVKLIEIFVEQLSPEEAQAWLYLIDLQLERAEIARIFGTNDTNVDTVILPITTPRANFVRLPLVTNQHLFGITPHVEAILQQVVQQTGPSIIAIDGLGGIGKTALATYVTHHVMADELFYDVIWISVRQEEYIPGTDVKATSQPELTIPMLVDAILAQAGAANLLSASAAEKQVIAQNLLKSKAYLIVIDNLETIAHYQSWITQLSTFTNPSKFLLTSRHQLHMYPNIFCYTLTELQPKDVVAFLESEANRRGLSAFLQAAQADWDQLRSVVGGHPLALKLILGQLSFLTLSQVLDNLVKAQGKSIEELYNHIYWQAWTALAEPSKQALLAMPLAQGGDFTQLLAICNLEDTQLQQALEQLVTLSLIIVTGTMVTRRYEIHRLTETFLLREVLKWQRSQEA